MNRKLLIPAGLLVALCIALASTFADFGPTRATASLDLPLKCPKVAYSEGEQARKDQNPRARAQFVPSGPVSLQLCRYWGFGSLSHQTPQTQARAGKLESQRFFSRPGTARSFAHAFNQLADGLRGLHSCPADEGASMSVTFGYPGQEPEVPVEVHLSGCREAINGRYETSKWTTPSLRHRLEELTRPEG